MGTGQPVPPDPGEPLPLQALVRAAKEMAQTPNPAEALWKLVMALREDLSVDRAGVFAFEPVTRTLRHITGVDRDGNPEYAGRSFHVGDQYAPLHQVARRERAFYFSNDVRGDFPNCDWPEGMTAHAIIPIMGGDLLLGTLNVDNCLSGAPLEESLLSPLFLFAGLAALPLFALYQKEERERIDLMRRAILRQVLSAVTDGKVCLCDRVEIAREWPQMEDAVAIQTVSDVPAWRDRVRELGLDAGMDPERARDFELCASEAATNALLHGNGGSAAVGRVDGCLRVRVVDRGGGIDAERLPPALLQAGTSTASSAGLGYTLIIEMCDRVFLHTGTEGTTLIVEMSVKPVTRMPEGWSEL